MGMGRVTGYEPMFTVFIMHPVQTTQFLQRFNGPVDSGMADALLFQYIGCIRDGIAVGCFTEQLPYGLSLIGITMPQAMEALLQIGYGRWISEPISPTALSMSNPC